MADLSREQIAQFNAIQEALLIIRDGLRRESMNPVQAAKEIEVIADYLRSMALASLPDDSVRVPAHADVLAERKRQIDVEGWTPEHDDSHDKGDMALAGACYAMHTSMMYLDCAKDDVPSPWPWDKSWWKPKDPRRNLVRAAALILAEIERIDRLAASEREAG